MRYARNVVQHVLHIVKPSEPQSMVGSSSLGFRIYSEWDVIPDAAHDALHDRTKELKPDYEARYLGRGVVEVMFEVLRFFAEVVPDAMHRDRTGEWTGFALQAQPAVSSPLHPEEPLEEADARAWLNSRRPNGDVRVVAGQITVDGAQHVVGFTFIGDTTFGPFVESAAQVEADMRAGMTYVKWAGAPSIDDVTPQFPKFLTGVVHRVTTAIPERTSPFDPSATSGDWYVGFSREVWEQVIDAELNPHTPGSVTYLIRRTRRLYAFYPIHR